MLIKSKRIAIIGGGPGGLTLARLLQMNGAEVKVYERDESEHVRVQGATLDLHEESGLKALATAGLMDAFKLHYRPGADKVRILDKHATIILDEHSSNTSRTFDDAAYRPEIDRGPLRKLLLDSLYSHTVVWDSHVVAMHPVEAAWRIDFKNGTSVMADIVIAADGANSKIRPLITPVKPFYSGITIVEGAVYNSEVQVPHIHALLNNGKIFAMGDSKSLIVSSKGDGSLVFYTGCKTDERWSYHCQIDFADRKQVAAWFEKEFAGWNNVWLELFTNASTNFIPRPQYCMPLDQTWEALPNLTMLGDAAHVMPPYAGEGVNMAMQDALQLSECLLNTNYATIHAAIGAYEKQMRARASEVARLTLESTDILHSPNAIAFMTQLLEQPNI